MPKLTHNEIVNIVSRQLAEQGYMGVRVRNRHWVPDISALDPNKTVISVYEIKPELATYNDLRSGLLQTLEGVIYGFKSYLVIDDKQLIVINKFLPFFPQIGIITYSNGDRKSLITSIRTEAEVPFNASEATQKVLAGNFIPKRKLSGYGKRRRKGYAVKVKSYSYTRNGELIVSPAYNRRRPNKESYNNRNLLKR